MIFKKKISSKEVSHQNLLHQKNLLKTSPPFAQKDMSPGHWNYSLEALKAPLANAFGSFPGTVLDAWAQCGQWGIRCAKAGAKDAGMENIVEKRGKPCWLKHQYERGDMGWLSLKLPKTGKYTWGEVSLKFQESWRICWRCRLCRLCRLLFIHFFVGPENTKNGVVSVWNVVHCF